MRREKKKKNQPRKASSQYFHGEAEQKKTNLRISNLHCMQLNNTLQSSVKKTRMHIIPCQSERQPSRIFSAGSINIFPLFHFSPRINKLTTEAKMLFLKSFLKIQTILSTRHRPHFVFLAHWFSACGIQIPPNPKNSTKCLSVEMKLETAALLNAKGSPDVVTCITQQSLGYAKRLQDCIAIQERFLCYIPLVISTDQSFESFCSGWVSSAFYASIYFTAINFSLTFYTHVIYMASFTT